MNSQYKQKTLGKSGQGFTIIEVVLVLAIAALIFLMVFIALPALQRGQRDTQRKDDLAKIQTQIENLKSNSRGSIPSSLDQSLTANTPSGKSFVAAYLGGSTNNVAGDEYTDPSTGEGYKFLAVNTAPTDKGQVGYYPGKLCATDGSGVPTATGAQARNYALVIFLEGQTVPYCTDGR